MIARNTDNYGGKLQKFQYEQDSTFRKKKLQEKYTNFNFNSLRNNTIINTIIHYTYRYQKQIFSRGLWYVAILLTSLSIYVRDKQRGWCLSGISGRQSGLPSSLTKQTVRETFLA